MAVKEMFHELLLIVKSIAVDYSNTLPPGVGRANRFVTRTIQPLERVAPTQRSASIPLLDDFEDDFIYDDNDDNDLKSPGDHFQQPSSSHRHWSDERPPREELKQCENAECQCYNALRSNFCHTCGTRFA